MNCTPEFDHNAPFVHALMCEITALLDDLASRGKEGAIDLRGLPLLDEDKQKLEALLGRGEVFATVSVMGKTQVWETAYAGVWWLRHMGAGDKIISEQINITTIPEILKTHIADAKASVERLQELFGSMSNKEPGETS